MNRRFILNLSKQSIVMLLAVFQITSDAAAQTEKPAEEKAVVSIEQPPVKPFVNTSAVLPKNFPVPGGIAVVPLNMRDAQKPVVKFGSRKVLVVPYQNQWQAVVGLPIDILPGNYILGTLDQEDETGKVAMRVITLPPPVPKEKEVEESSAPTNSHNRGAIPIQLDVNLASSDLSESKIRIPQELLIEDRGLKPSFVFTSVVESDLLIPYGKILHQKKIIEHNYLSFIGSPESQVYSPAPGVVVKVIENQSRNTELYIDHGGGMISVLSNLEKILVQEGQPLDRGEQIGKAGFDGSLDRSRVDYGLSLNGFLIDPLQFSSSP